MNMQPHLFVGILLVMLAGAMCGNCMTPLQQVRTWKWENAWLVFSFVSLVQVLFGISIVNLGMALGFSIIVGLGALFGTLVPVLVQRPEVLATAKGGLLLAGTAVMVVGVAVCGYAGRERERTETIQTVRSSGTGYTAALILAILCGVLAPMVNFALAFGDEIAKQAVRGGTDPANAAFAVWPLALAGGFVPNAAYSIYLLSRNRSWAAFGGRIWPDAGYSVLMGVLWMGAVAIYGVATRYFGTLGTSAGWGLYQIFMIVAANISGLIAGEWSKAGGRAMQVLLCGLLLLAIATVLMSIANG